MGMCLLSYHSLLGLLSRIYLIKVNLRIKQGNLVLKDLFGLVKQESF